MERRKFDEEEGREERKEPTGPVEENYYRLIESYEKQRTEKKMKDELKQR